MLVDSFEGKCENLMGFKFKMLLKFWFENLFFLEELRVYYFLREWRKMFIIYCFFFLCFLY